MVTELDLSEKLKMSRTPIREALQDLEAEGLVKSYPARGTIVTELMKSDVEEIHELRVLLEVWALKKSFIFIHNTDLDYAENLFKEAYESQNWDKFHIADRFLHNLMVVKSGSTRVIGFLHALNSQIERIRRVSARDVHRIDASYAEHMEIIDKIRMHNLDQALTTLEKHLRSVSNSAIQTFQNMEIALPERILQ